MTAARITRRKATRRPRRSSPSGDPARLVPLQLSSKANIKQSLHPLYDLPNTLAYRPAGPTSQLLPPISTIATVRIEPNSP